MHQRNDITIDLERFELRCRGTVRHVEPQVFNLIRYLVENRERVVTKDELIEAVWNGRIVSDSTLSSRITAARRALDDNGQRQQTIQTVPRRGFRLVADVDTVHFARPMPMRMPSPPRAGWGEGALPAQEVRICSSPDGTGLAFAVAGDGYPIVKSGNWLSHIEYDWHSPVWNHLLRFLVCGHQLVRYDARGNGLSDWDVNDFRFEALVSDLETVVDATSLDRFVLFGLSQGCAISAAYAARHPRRVKGLVLYGGYCRGWKRRDRRDLVEQEEAMLALARAGWGRNNPAFRQMFTHLFVPEGSNEQVHWYNELQRVSTSGDNVVSIDKALGDIDIRELLPKIDVPALVLHCRDDAVVPFEEGRLLARLLPNARFVALPGRNHIMLEGDVSWPRFQSEFTNFLQMIECEERPLR